MAPISAILHRYGIRMLGYLDDWLILAESRTTCLQARDRLLPVCEELGLQVNFKKSFLIPSQDMTYLGMQIQSVRFIAKPTETRVETLLKIIEEFLSSPGPPAALWRRLLGHLSEKTNKGIVVGMLPRSYVSHFALSKAIAINERMKKYCDQKKVEFIDLWGMFVGKRHLFRKDGIHLSEAGQRKFGEILNKECEKVMRSDRIGTRESSEVSPVSRLQGIEENENLEYSFLGFTKEN